MQLQEASEALQHVSTAVSTAVPDNDSHCHNMGWVLTLHVNVDLVYVLV